MLLFVLFVRLHLGLTLFNFILCDMYCRPTSLDAIVFGYLGELLKVPYPNTTLQNHLKGCPNLVSFCRRILNTYFPLSPEGNILKKLSIIGIVVCLSIVKNVKSCVFQQKAAYKIEEWAKIVVQSLVETILGQFDTCVCKKDRFISPKQVLLLFQLKHSQEQCVLSSEMYSYN